MENDGNSFTIIAPKALEHQESQAYMKATPFTIDDVDDDVDVDKHLSTKYWFGKYWISSRQDAIESKVFSFLISQLQISSAKLRVKHFLNLSQIKLWNFPILANKNLLNQNQISDEGKTSSCAKWNIFAILLWENSIKKKSFGWRLFAFRNLGELKSFGRKIT